MAIYPLLFGYVEGPDDKPARLPLPRPSESSDTTRLTLRVPESLKRRVEDSAALEGLAPDTWITRALSRSVDPRLETR